MTGSIRCRIVKVLIGFLLLYFVCPPILSSLYARYVRYASTPYMEDLKSFVVPEDKIYVSYKFTHDRSKLDKNEEFTVVVLTYNRNESMLKLLQHLDKLPKLNQVIVIWNNMSLDGPNPALEWPVVSYKLRVLTTMTNSLNNRFLPLSIVKTEAIFHLDDDVFVVRERILNAFQVWRYNRDRLVGFHGRGVKYSRDPEDPNSVGKWVYYSSGPAKIGYASLVLTGSAFVHRSFSELYTYEMPEEIRNTVDEKMNCEDIAMNFLVADRIHQATIFLEHPELISCKGCASTGLWRQASHFDERTDCLNQFYQIYGYMPLLHQKDIEIEPSVPKSQ